MNPAPLEFDDDDAARALGLQPRPHALRRLHARRPARRRHARHRWPAALPAAAAAGRQRPAGHARRRLPVRRGAATASCCAGSCPQAKRIIGLDLAGERIALLSQRALYLYDAARPAGSDGVLQPRLRVPTPGKVGNLTRIELMELLDGVLVSFMSRPTSTTPRACRPAAALSDRRAGHGRDGRAPATGLPYGPVYITRTGMSRRCCTRPRTPRSICSPATRRSRMT